MPARLRLDGRCAVLSREIDTTADSLDAFHPGDGDARRRLHGTWKPLGTDIVDTPEAAGSGGYGRPVSMLGPPGCSPTTARR